MQIIKLTQGKEAIIDDEDFEYLNQWKWCFIKCISGGGYASRSIRNGKKTTTILMHRLINKTVANFDTDHINGNKLDNRKHNLRTTTRSQNKMNSKKRENVKYKGVSILKVKDTNNTYTYIRAQIRINNKGIHLGYYSTQEEAALAYNYAAKHYFGEYAKLNIL